MEIIPIDRVRRAGHLKKNAGGTVQLDLRGVNSQSVLVTLQSLCLWKQCARWVQGRVLDVGCGSQPYRLLFAYRYLQWVGLDRMDPRQPGYELDLRADGQALPFGSETFDTVIAAEVLEHLPSPERFWEEANRVLKHGGRILLSMPFLYWIHEAPYDFQRFTQYGLSELAARNGFQILYLRPRGGVVTVLLDLLFKCFSGVFGLLNKLGGFFSPRDNKRADLRQSILGRIILAWPQVALGFILKRERIMADKITSGYMLVAEKAAEKPL